jgi:hypothetical protein
MDCSGVWPFRLLSQEGSKLHKPSPETRLSMSSGRVGGETHSEVADMAVAVDKSITRRPGTVTDASGGRLTPSCLLPHLRPRH